MASKIRHNYMLVSVLSLLAGSSILIGAFADSSGTPIHSVTGSAEVSGTGVTFRTTVAARRDANGQVGGLVTVGIDLKDFGLRRVTFQNDVTCLEVVGSSAWIGAVVTHSTDPNFVSVGDAIIIRIEDLGNQAGDRIGVEIPSFVACADRPELRTSIVKGNFNVR